MKNASKPQQFPAVCPLDCPDTCSLSVSTIDNTIVDVRGSQANPYTAAVVCSKVAKYYPEFVHGAKRLRHPLRRVGARGAGQFERIDWDQALDLVYQGFNRAIDKYGSQSTLGFNYAGPHGELAGGSMDRRFFHRLGSSQLDRCPLCGGVRGNAYTSLFGNAPGMPPEQASQSDLVVVWGNNVTVSNLHLARVIKQVRAQGGKLIVIDPKQTRIAEQAHLYLQIKPGTDVVLALALAAEFERRAMIDTQFVDRWVDGFAAYMQAARQTTPAMVEQICGLELSQFNLFADLYQHAKRVAVSLGNGIERGRCGGSGLRAAMALQALSGNFGKFGAGIIAKPGLAVPRTTERLQRPDLLAAGTRCFNIVDIATSLLDQTLEPPLKAIMIYNHNPVATHPDQNRMIEALSQNDLFIAGCDVVMTDSMAYADVILPAASAFEIADLYGSYGHSYLQRAEPVMPPLGESLPNTEIFRRLARRFGFDDDLFRSTDAELMDQALINDDPRLGGYRPSQLPLDRALLMQTSDGAAVVMCKTVKPDTVSGKIELYSDRLEQDYGFGLPRYLPPEPGLPLAIISPSSAARTNATFGGCNDSLQPEQVEIHPQTAAVRSIKDGAPVRVWNKLGEVELIAKISTKVTPDVLYSPKGTWLESSRTGQTVNALISSTIRTDIMDGACYNETYVEIEPATTKRASHG